MNDPHFRDHRPVNPLLVAQKIARVRNFEEPRVLDEINAEPRLVEILWFLAYVSRPENYAGGMRKFAADLVNDSIDLIGTPTMQSAGSVYSAETLYQIHMETPDWQRDQLREIAGQARREDVLPLCLSAAQARREDVLPLCLSAADDLPRYLFQLCEIPAVEFRRAGSGFKGGADPWYFPRVAEAILRFIDRRKSLIAATIAETEISREIFKWLGKAVATKRAVVIEGNSRFGKTEAIRAWCAMNPGRARIVETPPANSESDLLRAVAKALGLDLGKNHRGYEMREEIGAIAQASGLCLVFEEAQMLYPANFTRNTMPARWNWVRRTLMDAGLPCAFVWTPQSHRDARTRYLKATGFAIEQLDGRILKTVRLPDEISREDLLAIAQIHFRGMPEPYLEYVVRQAVATERNYCSDVANIAALSFSNAEDAGHSKPTLDDVKAAIADVLPAASVRPASAGRENTAGESAPKRPRKRSARPVNPPCKPRAARTPPPSPVPAATERTIEAETKAPAEPQMRSAKLAKTPCRAPAKRTPLPAPGPREVAPPSTTFEPVSRTDSLVILPG